MNNMTNEELQNILWNQMQEAIELGNKLIFRGDFKKDLEKLENGEIISAKEIKKKLKELFINCLEVYRANDN